MLRLYAVRACAVLPALAFFTGASAQQLTTYEYDARGRLVATVDAEARTDYDYDDADNRENVTRQTLFPNNWLATSLPHNVGYAEGGGWAADVTLTSNHMTYGPYATDIAVGNNVAVWRVMIDAVAGPNDNIITVDVYDATAGEILEIVTFERNQWAADFTYQMFEVPFVFDAARAGHAVEFRTYYHSNAYVRVQRIGYHPDL